MYQEIGFLSLYCDNKVAMKGGFYFWSYLFYISKFWEYVDTFILVLKKSEVKLLHSWHHSVISWTCLLFIRYKFAWFLFGVQLNATIHTFMYFYYFLTTFNIRPSWGKYLTSAQMVQFIVGGISFWPMFFVCDSIYDNLPIVMMNQMMLVTFLYMFRNFFIKKYVSPSPSSSKSVSSENKQKKD